MSLPPIEITEFRPKVLGAAEFSQEAAEFLQQESFRTWFRVRTMGSGSRRQWQVTSSGGVGQVELPDGRVLRVAPRVTVQRIFEMWQIAHPYSPRWLPGSVSVATVADLYEWIVRDLANGTRTRLRRGISRSYVQVADKVRSVRGRLDVTQVASRPLDVSLPCIFEQFSADIPDNQILASALRVAARTLGPCPTRDMAEHAYHELVQQGVRARPVQPEDCLGRRYDRLNQEYEWLHWLSYFVLSNRGPDHGFGDAPLRSFMIGMPDLFERYVREWLRRELQHGGDYMVCRTSRRKVAERNWFIPDVIIEDRHGTPRIVLDMKYKLDVQRHDVNQVIAYATNAGCLEAALVYPSHVQAPVHWQVGPVRVRPLVFQLDVDLNTAGRQFLTEALGE